jgi:acyl-CoA thioester hydrolase
MTSPSAKIVAASDPATGAEIHASVLTMRVYYEDTDAAGIVYYANYLKFAERARTEMLRTIDPRYCNPTTSHGIAFAVRHCTADFIAPARLDDLIEIRTHILNVSGATFSLEQVIKRNGVDLVRLNVRLACINAAGRAARIPPGLRMRLGDGTSRTQRSG